MGELYFCLDTTRSDTTLDSKEQKKKKEQGPQDVDSFNKGTKRVLLKDAQSKFCCYYLCMGRTLCRFVGVYLSLILITWKSNTDKNT